MLLYSPLKGKCHDCGGTGLRYDLIEKFESELKDVFDAKSKDETCSKCHGTGIVFVMASRPVPLPRLDTPTEKG